jgi:predicted metal-dependent hydrolase
MAMEAEFPTQSPARRDPSATTTRVQARPLPEGVSIKVRRPKLDIEGDHKDWAGDNNAFSRFMEGLSMLFPEGERFFVESVNKYRDQIVDPVLKKQVGQFAAQEGMHAVEHHKYNVRAAGPLAEELEAVAGLLRRPGVQRLLSPINRLAITVALEHFTAIMADELLRNRVYAQLMDAEHAKLWLWHAVEETEHKAVAFDVYKAVGGSYPRRAATMHLMTLLFFIASFGLLMRLLRNDGRGVPARDAGTFLNLAFGNPGFFRKVFPAWLSFFRPSFHPWDHDNSDLIAAWKSEYADA